MVHIVGFVKSRLNVGLFEKNARVKFQLRMCVLFFSDFFRF